MANPNPNASPAPPAAPPGEPTVPELVAQVYEAATNVGRRQLLEPLLRPLGALSLVAVAGGVFAKIRFRSGWQVLNVRLEDIETVRAAHVMALVEFAQQVSVDAVDGLAAVLAASPGLYSTAAAASLCALLMKRMRRVEGEAPAAPDAADAGHRR